MCLGNVRALEEGVKDVRWVSGTVSGTVSALEEGVKEVRWVSGRDEANTQQSLAHSLNIFRHSPFEDNII